MPMRQPILWPCCPPPAAGEAQCPQGTPAASATTMPRRVRPTVRSFVTIMKTLFARRGVCVGVIGVLTLTAAAACTGRQQENPRPRQGRPGPLRRTCPIPDTASPLDAVPEAVRLSLEKRFDGDFDEMVKRRAIRVGVTFNRTHVQQHLQVLHHLPSGQRSAGPS